ncbi:unnamed protein product [Polarella glacialis]|uniref:Uncharacterized protein n=1 Tax=Polarella glacialis TaxID=89957 RepID=A0A813HEQ8_POLGL|nr:unnamed protein product [Polarella glacialis]
MVILTASQQAHATHTQMTTPPMTMRAGRSLDVSLVDIGGNEIVRGTWHGQCKVLELFQAAYRVKPGFLCKLLHGSVEVNAQRNLDDLATTTTPTLQCLTVVWLNGAVRHSSRNDFAFAAIKSDGSVITWGDVASGGDSSLVADRLQEAVVQVVGNDRAFAAIKSGGSVITWGDEDYGADSSLVADGLQKAVVQVVGNGAAFAAIKSDGSVITWGDVDYGGDSCLVADRLQEGVVQVVGGGGAFAAIKSDGSVITWGDVTSGGESSHVADRLQEGVVLVVS